MEQTKFIAVIIILLVSVLIVGGCTSQQNQITGEVVRETEEPTGPKENPSNTQLPNQEEPDPSECEKFESDTYRTTCYMQIAIREKDETICDNIVWNIEQKLACRDAVKQFKDLGYLGSL